MKLNVESYDSKAERADLIIIHGLFGSASNFRGLAGKYADSYNVHCLDLRNHGGSPHSEEVTYPLMAADVAEFMDDRNIDNAHILGHSMGGKTAMQLAMNYPTRIKRLIVADIAPVEYPHHHVTIFAGLNSVNFSQVKSRGEVEQGLKNYVEDAGIRSFLMTNLVRNEDGGFKWRINTQALMNNYDHIRAAPEGAPYQGETLFIRGGNSTYVQDQHIPKTMQVFPNAKIETMAGCGHWPHAEKPGEFSEILLGFIKQG